MSGRRSEPPRRLGDILKPTVQRLTSGDEARAYAVWARAAGDQVGEATRPRAFSHGALTVECESSVWANELTYLSRTILARMGELDPGHPVRRLRFWVRRRAPMQEEPPAASNDRQRGASLHPEDVSAAQAAAGDVADERLRSAIEAALRAASTDSGGPLAPEPDRHPKK